MKKTAKFSAFILFIFLGSLPLTSFSQSRPYSVTGKLLDAETKQPIEYASVAIFKLPDSTLVTGVSTNGQGVFTINNLGNGRYFLRSSFVGYKNGIKQFEINGSNVKLTEPIHLQPAALSIGEVIVTGTRSEKQQSVEKTTINVAKNIAAVSGNITDVLKGQAGINIDNEENIYVRGNKNTLVLMDGVPTTLSSLNSIPASNVENIEIITNPDVKYDAEGTGGIINIVTKRRGEAGFSGRVMLNYNFGNSVNGGLNLHYSKGIWDFDFGYNGKYDKYDINSTLDRFLYSDEIRVQQEMLSRQLSTSHTGTFMMAVRPSKKDVISLGLKGVLPELHNKQSIIGTQTDNTNTVTHFNRLNDIDHLRRMFETTFSYKHIFEKGKHELSFDASYSRNRGRRPAEYYIEDILLQKSTGGGDPTNMAVQADYLKSVSKTGKIEFGLKGLSKYNNFDYKFYDLNTGTDEWILDPAFSNDLKYQEYIYSSYLMYSDKLSKKLEYKIGARLEYNTSELTQASSNERIYHEYWFPFPFAQLKYTLDDSQNIALSINRRITRPTYPQINPFISVVDQTTYETGNKHLVPEIQDKVELNYSLIKNSFQLRTNLFASISKDYITQVSMLSDADKLMLTYVNGSRQNKIGADLDITYKFNKYISVNPAFSVFHTRSTGQYNEIDLSTDDFAWTGSLKTTIKPEKRTEVQIFLNYNSPLSLPQFRLGEIYYADISVRRSFLDNKLSVSLTMTDVFNTRKWNIESDNAVYKLDNYSKNQTRMVWLGLTFNFNSYKANKPQKSGDGEIDNRIIKLGD